MVKYSLWGIGAYRYHILFIFASSLPHFSPIWGWGIKTLMILNLSFVKNDGHPYTETVQADAG